MAPGPQFLAQVPAAPKWVRGGIPHGTGTSRAVAPASLSVPIASAGAVTLTVARTGTVGDRTLTAQGRPAGVTAAFATNPIPEGATTSEVTLTVAGGTAPTSGQITVRATAGITERTASLTFASTANTLSGNVRGDRAGVTADLTAPTPVVAATKGLMIAILDTPTTVSGTRSGTGDLTSPVAASRVAASRVVPHAVAARVAARSRTQEGHACRSTRCERVIGIPFESGAPRPGATPAPLQRRCAANVYR